METCFSLVDGTGFEPVTSCV